MGRGRKGVIDQGNKKNYKTGGLLPNEDRIIFWGKHKKNSESNPVYYLPEEVLNAFRQMNPRDVVNIIVNP